MADQTLLDRDLRSCLRVAEFVFSEPTLDKFLRLVLVEAMRRVDADRGSIFLLDRGKQELVGFAMTGIDDPAKVSLPVTQGLVGHVAISSETLNIRDAYADKRFFSGVDQDTGYRTRAVLCCPMQVFSEFEEADDHRTVGVLELLNPRSKEHFDDDDERAATRLLSFASVRLREYSLIEEVLRSHERLQNEVANFRGYADENAVFRSFVGKSSVIERLKQMIWTVAPYDSSVLILGESGTGKELVARCVHGLSTRKDGPFVAINCAAVPETLLESELFGIESGVATGVSKRIGKVEQANSGTLFLDEIGEMSASMQAKLLRVLQEKEITRVGGKSPIAVDVRIVCATLRKLDQLVAKGDFREDLYYRLKVVGVDVPSLRERKEDIPYLSQFFLNNLNEKYGVRPVRHFSPEVLLQFERMDWPGNVRQLQNEVERLFILGGNSDGLISPEQVSVVARAAHKDPVADSADKLPVEAHEGIDSDRGILTLGVLHQPLAEILSKVERILVLNALQRNHGNKTHVAEELGISREGLRKMLIRWGVEGEVEKSKGE
jgi:transcriptional regulator with PAS, ATPase and Fis domain